MIIDKLENIGRYALMIKNCEALQSFVTKNDLAALSTGRYALENTDIQVSLFEYDTKIGSETRWETHHEHMDIHIVIEGCEEVAWIPAVHVTQSVQYVSERDVEFFIDDIKGSRVLLEAGYFCLVMPEDAHKPALAPMDDVRHGKKAVVKVAVG